MYPYIRIGPILLWTYGLTIGFAFVCAWRVLEVNLRRHNLPPRLAQRIILLLVISGIVGAKLYAVLEGPAQLLAHPFSSVFSSNGYTWFGGFLGGVPTLWFLAKRFNIPSLVLLDLASPSAALGYGVARLGCLLAGDGDYGIATSLPWGMSFPNGLVPTREHVHPTPLYECLAGLMIFFYLWRLGKRDLPHGNILARYLVLTGIARFLVECLRLNPPTVLNLSNAQIMSLLCVAVALMLFGHNALTLHWRTLVDTRYRPK
jgi:phosphatidylglycerol---prolipoprotein diacylglyceryl transferase